MSVQEQFNTIDYGDEMVLRILAAAEQCIERYGIRRTTVGEVARVGKLSRGSVYRYFGDKEALVDGVLKHRREAFLNRTEATLEQLPTLVDKLTESVMSGRRDMREGFFARLAETEPDTVAAIFRGDDFFRRSVSFWPAHIELAQQSGEISAELPVSLATDFVMRLAVSLVFQQDLGLSLEGKAALRRYLSQVVTAGLGAPAEG